MVISFGLIIQNNSSYPFVLKNNNFEVDLSGLAAGEYTFSVRSSEGNISRSGTIKILEYNVEQQFLNANVTKLQNLANSSEGSHYFIDDTSNLINELLTDSRFVTVQKSSKKVPRWPQLQLEQAERCQQR